MVILSNYEIKGIKTVIQQKVVLFIQKSSFRFVVFLSIKLDGTIKIGN